jgi:hypothetical protein
MDAPLPPWSVALVLCVCGLVLGGLPWFFSFQQQRARWLRLLDLQPDAEGIRTLPVDDGNQWTAVRLRTFPAWLVWLCGRPCGRHYLWSPNYLTQVLGWALFLLLGLVGTLFAVVLELAGPGLRRAWNFSGLAVFLVFTLAVWWERRRNDRDPQLRVGPLQSEPSSPTDGTAPQVPPGDSTFGWCSERPISWSFLAMQHYRLFLNLTYRVYVTEQSVCGARVAGLITSPQTKEEQWAQHPGLFANPALEIRYRDLDPESDQFLARDRANFRIGKVDMLRVEEPAKKWGMGLVPYSGRLVLITRKGTRHELILLGEQDRHAIAQRLCS